MSHQESIEDPFFGVKLVRGRRRDPKVLALPTYTSTDWQKKLESSGLGALAFRYFVEGGASFGVQLK